jgi:hypothetical protein
VLCASVLLLLAVLGNCACRLGRACVY